MSEFIKISKHDRIQSVCINRPDKKNALNLEMYSALAAAIHNADTDDSIRVSYLTGAGDAFCSGNDINDFLKDPPVDESSPVLQFVNAIIMSQKPIVAAVNGVAVGIGTTMLLHCDLVFASREAQFQLPFVNIGLCPEAGSTYILTAMAGRQKAAELFLLGEMFSAEQARETGIVNRVVPAAELEQTAMSAAMRIAEQPPNAVKVTRELLRSAVQSQILEAGQRETENIVTMLHGAEAGEALAAFMEKRKPDFSRLQE